MSITASTGGNTQLLRDQPRRNSEMSDDYDKVWPTGLNLKEAEEVHSYLIDGTRVFGAIALIAHMLVAVSTPWLG
jgi:light-harvesting protein B-800-850 beta chain